MGEAMKLYHELKRCVPINLADHGGITVCGVRQNNKRKSKHPNKKIDRGHKKNEKTKRQLNVSPNESFFFFRFSLALWFIST